MNLVQGYLPLHRFLEKSRIAEGIAPLLLRLYLAPILMQAGWNKLSHFADTVDWFASPDYGLGLPMPALMASLAIAAEFLGSMFLLVGLATRWVSIPLMVTMLVAAFAVHFPNGWPAIADASSWLSNGTLFYNDAVMSAPDKLSVARDILQEHGNYDWLSSSGKFVILNNGMEFAMTYFIMLLVLFFTGGGRYTSVDYFLAKRFLPKE